MGNKNLGLAILLTIPLAMACSPNTLGGTGVDDGGSDAASFVDPCLAAPNSSTQCWLDGARNGSSQNPTCSGTATTISGKVTIPAGTLPLYNAKVYITQVPAPDDPMAPTNLPAIVHGSTCDTCDKIVPPDAVASTVSDINGNFTLTKVPYPPSGKAMYLVIRVGKWRRYVRMENSDSINPKASKLNHCAANALAPDVTRMPRNRSEGDIPRIALSTGVFDALECILRSPKLGLDDSEFTTEADSGSVNLYAGNGTDQFSPALGGKKFTASVDMPNPSWWDTESNWHKYDIVMLSCEGDTRLASKSPTARANLQKYINQGGRVFASHWHLGWIQSGPMPLSTVASFYPNTTDYAYPGTINTDLVTTFQKGADLKSWLKNANALTGTNQLPVQGGKNTIISLNPSVSQSWVTYLPAPNLVNQYFSFYAPVGAPPATQCGQMVFTDLHVSGGVGDSSAPGTAAGFPKACTTMMLSAQEAALIFLFFDLTNCIQPVIG